MNQPFHLSSQGLLQGLIKADVGSSTSCFPLVKRQLGLYLPTWGVRRSPVSPPRAQHVKKCSASAEDSRIINPIVNILKIKSKRLLRSTNALQTKVLVNLPKELEALRVRVYQCCWVRTAAGRRWQRRGTTPLQSSQPPASWSCSGCYRLEAWPQPCTCMGRPEGIQILHKVYKKKQNPAAAAAAQWSLCPISCSQHMADNRSAGQEGSPAGGLWQRDSFILPTMEDQFIQFLYFCACS